MNAPVDMGPLVQALARKMEPPERRTRQPVRRNSRYAGGERRTWVRWTDLPDLRRALDRMSQDQHVPGRRRGAGGAAISLAYEKVLIAMMEMSAKWRGAVYPTHQAIAAWARVGLTSVKRALRLFADMKLIEWDRRLEVVADAAPGERGPQVRQISNFYRVLVGPLMPILARLRSRANQAGETAAAQDAARKAKVLKDLRRLQSDSAIAAALGPRGAARLAAKLASDDGETTRRR